VLMLFRLWVIIIFLCVFTWRYILLIFKEEKKLLAMFPGAYPDYRQKVPRLLPSPAAILQKDIAEYLPLKVSWLKKETGSITTVLLLVLFMESWMDFKGAGIKACLKGAGLSLTTIIVFIFFIIYLIRRANNQKKDASSKSKNTL